MIIGSRALDKWKERQGYQDEDFGDRTQRERISRRNGGGGPGDTGERIFKPGI